MQLIALLGRFHVHLYLEDGVAPGTWSVPYCLGNSFFLKTYEQTRIRHFKCRALNFLKVLDINPLQSILFDLVLVFILRCKCDLLFQQRSDWLGWFSQTVLIKGFSFSSVNHLLLRLLLLFFHLEIESFAYVAVCALPAGLALITVLSKRVYNVHNALLLCW